MKGQVLISNIFSGETISKALFSFSPSKLILVVENLEGREDVDKVDKIKKSIEKIKNDFGDLLDIEEFTLTSQYELDKITSEIIRKIDSIKGKDILLNVSEGRKTMSFGMTFAGYLRRERVKKIFYITEETKEIVQLPMFEFSITDKQKRLLEKIQERTISAKSLVEELKDSARSTVYQSIKELIEKGYLISTDEGNLKVTDSGKIFFIQ